MHTRIQALKHMKANLFKVKLGFKNKKRSASSLFCVTGESLHFQEDTCCVRHRVATHSSVLFRVAPTGSWVLGCIGHVVCALQPV